MEDRNYIDWRWLAGPTAAFAAEVDDELAGTAFGVNWGSLGVFGPLTVHPSVWNQSVAKSLLDACIQRQVKAGARDIVLFTSPDSPKHLGLYQKFDFWPRFLTAVMSKQTSVNGQVDAFLRYSALKPVEQQAALEACRELTASVLEGLDLSSEIRMVADQNLGDTLLLSGLAGVDAFAVCHCGVNTEAGTGNCYVKFGVARDAKLMRTLLDSAESFAASRALTKTIAGISTARIEAYRLMFDAGYKTDSHGIAMHRPNRPLHSRPGVFVLDDWR